MTVESDNVEVVKLGYSLAESVGIDPDRFCKLMTNTRREELAKAIAETVEDETVFGAEDVLYRSESMLIDNAGIESLDVGDNVKRAMAHEMLRSYIINRVSENDGE